MKSNGPEGPGKLDQNRLAGLLMLLVIVIIAAHSGYRLHIGITGFTFEQNGAAQVSAR
jgi:hypothetical protein